MTSEPVFYVEDLALALSLRKDRLLTASLRFEPAFKHEEDPDELLAAAAGGPRTKKQRRVAQFAFERLLPLRLTHEETLLALEQGRIGLEILSDVCVRCIPGNGDASLADHSALSRWRQTVEQSPRFAVFKKLWEAGMTMVDGLKFGVDFLAYTGDPTRCHANHMVLVTTSDSEKAALTALDLVALVNVAAKAKKTLLAARVTSEGTVSFCALHRRPVMFVLNKDRRKRRVNAALTEEELLEEVEE